MMRSLASPWLSWCRLCLFLVLSLASTTSQAMSQDIMDRLTSRDFATRSTAIEEVVATAATGDEAARELLQGLRENRVEGVRLNNALRRQVAEATSVVALTAPEVAQRQAAVDTLLRSPPSAELLPVVEQAIADESHEPLRRQLQLLMAMMTLQGTDELAKVAAIERIAATGEPRYRSMLRPLAADTAVAADAGSDATRAAIRDAATIAIRRLDIAEQRAEAVGTLFAGLSLGSILLLAALGLAITYGLMGVINLAHGEFLMIGAYATYVVQNLFRQYLPGAFDWYPLAALPVAFLSAALIGVVLERLIIRHLYGRPLETLLTTFGISLLLMQSVRMIFGAQNVEVMNPSWMSGSVALMPGLLLPWSRLAIILFALIVILATWLVLNRTRLGLFVRAATQNRTMAACAGVPTASVDTRAFAFGAGVAGLGGCALSQIGNVGPDLGQAYIIDSFLVVVLGGVGQLAGALVGAFGLGILAKVLEPFWGAVLAKIAVLAIIILFIQKRPQGLFALKGRSVEA